MKNFEKKILFLELTLVTAKCHLLSNRYFHCHKKNWFVTDFIFTVNKNNILKWVIVSHLARPRMATLLIGRCHISMKQNNNFEWKIVSHLVSVRPSELSNILRNIFIFRFRVRKQTSKKTARSMNILEFGRNWSNRNEQNRHAGQWSGEPECRTGQATDHKPARLYQKSRF